MFDSIETISGSANLPLFVPANLLWGFGLIIFSLLFSMLTWRAMRGLTEPGYRLRAFALWLINASLLITGVVMITKAFPRLNPLITFAFLFVLIVAFVGGGVAVKKKDEKEGAKEEPKK
ncbi:MAG: hypothetical protein Q8P45_01450 [Candidatus Harrisonbacteria bacterium]|nr:hypothetical protein [Candidatus Harrisonbacteria bacterium]